MKQLTLFLLVLMVLPFGAYAQVKVNECKGSISFIRALGHEPTRSAMTTSESKVMGIQLMTWTPDGQRSFYQHPSWKQGGWLSSLVITSKGDVFVNPSPLVNVLHNKPEEQNFLYKIDGQTGIMQKACELPRAGAATPENVYGLLGIAYDCESGVLFTSSIAGSTRDAEKGRIQSLRSDDYTMLGTLDSIDCFGLAIGYISNEKRLYFSRIRSNDIQSIALDAQGNFVGKPRLELSLEGLGPRGDDVARKIKFTKNGQMQVYGIEFHYNLIAPTEKQETIYAFEKNSAQQWQLVGME